MHTTNESTKRMNSPQNYRFAIDFRFQFIVRFVDFVVSNRLQSCECGHPTLTIRRFTSVSSRIDRLHISNFQSTHPRSDHLHRETIGRFTNWYLIFVPDYLRPWRPPHHTLQREISAEQHLQLAGQNFREFR